MSFEGPQAMTAGDLPQLQRIVIAPRQRAAAIRTQENGCDLRRVSFEGPHALTAGDSHSLSVLSSLPDKA